MIELKFEVETWKYIKPFVISREVLEEDRLIVVSVTENGLTGRGEGVPVGYAGESIDSVLAQLNAIKHKVREGMVAKDIQVMLPHGAARNALDCALWDLQSKRKKQSIWQLVGLTEFNSLNVTLTLGIDTPEVMANDAKEANLPLYKVKLKGDGLDMQRLQAINAACPKARLIIDANEGWNFEQLQTYVAEMQQYGVELIEQPLMVGMDHVLEDYKSPIPLCADESCNDHASLEGLEKRYDFINIKLDKTGGLTEALVLAKAAQEKGLGLMVGCMAGTSLSMAAGAIIGQLCQFVDLDGPLLYLHDRNPAANYSNGVMTMPEKDLWGEGK